MLFCEVHSLDFSTLFYQAATIDAKTLEQVIRRMGRDLGFVLVARDEFVWRDFVLRMARCISTAAKLLDTTPQDVMFQNLEKLAKRYDGISTE
jgi:hypothetical protein